MLPTKQSPSTTTGQRRYEAWSWRPAGPGTKSRAPRTHRAGGDIAPAAGALRGSRFQRMEEGDANPLLRIGAMHGVESCTIRAPPLGATSPPAPARALPGSVGPRPRSFSETITDSEKLPEMGRS